MADGFENDERRARRALEVDVAATADLKINALLDLLAQKGVIEPREANGIRVAKVL